ncbi:hypothetical protein NDU88_001772 [Pleurodeles waltl]|uniref:Uncharacterized protein n=1 Tax=Pleurodeles waltl TaxID=8319 RepID=A0AAV7P558_PLEWA|nr:hypothetical protein NDU88_001772 [Pleurodeles waltl]
MKQDRAQLMVPGTSGVATDGCLQLPTGGSLKSTLTAHSSRFDEILAAVFDIKAMLEPKIDALKIDMGLLREDHKKLKERAENA